MTFEPGTVGRWPVLASNPDNGDSNSLMSSLRLGCPPEKPDGV